MLTTRAPANLSVVSLKRIRFVCISLDAVRFFLIICKLLAVVHSPVVGESMI